jgi:hypothetical protein
MNAIALSPGGRTSLFRVNVSFVRQLVASDLTVQAAGGARIACAEPL